MITMQLYYTGQNGNALKFAQEMEKDGIADKIRAAERNLAYRYYQSLTDPETILLVDSWKDQAALDDHHASPMMQDILDLRQKYQLNVQAERYISDAAGIPEHDRDYLKNER